VGTLTLPARIGIDTNCLIYLAEWHGSERQRFLRERVFDGDRELVVSTLALAEILVKVYQSGLSGAATRAALESLPGIHFVAPSADIAQEAARIRAATRFRLPDAVHIATAAVSGAEAFLTNDAQLDRLSAGIPILLLDRLIRDDMEGRSAT